jgi:hypothetical protein
MTHKMSQDDQKFKESFESCEFPVSEFDHRAHLRLAYVYLIGQDTNASSCSMRESLYRFLQHNGIDPTKYHETLTKAWILAVHHFMNKTACSDSADSFIDQNPMMLDTSIMMTHYSAELLFSDEARKSFVEPDRDPIPRHSR